VANLGDIKEIVECNNQTDANNYLRLGWRLIRTYSANVSARYVLGWTGEGSGPHPELAAQAGVNYLDAMIAAEKAKLTELERQREARGRV
jgi:hypothetical protein